MSRPLKHRDIACARCFRLKRRCDHAKPTCGECYRKGAECLPARSRRTGESVTIPVAYLKDLEKRVAELEDHSRASGSSYELCDAGVQTDFIENGEPFSTTIPIPSPPIPDGSPRWEPDFALDDRALMLLSPSQIHQRTFQSPSNLQYAFTEPLLRGYDDTLDFLRLDRSPSYSLIQDTTSDSHMGLELYSTLYFSISHREWPFLNESAWKQWQREGRDGGEEDWRTFFLQMVYAIGASLLSTMHSDKLHSCRARELYCSAMNYYAHVVCQPSMVLQVQASLLLIVYALHSPSSDEILTTVSSIVPFCTATMIEIRRHARTNIDGEIVARTGEILTENMFIACYMLNVIIISGWDRPVSDAYSTVDEDMRTLGEAIEPPPSINPALSHLFRLRKIQSRIRRSLEKSRWQFFEDRHAANSSMKSALKIWRQEIPRFSKTDVDSGYYHPNWMTKLYDYSILMLMEDKHNFLDQEETEEIFAAVVEVCIEYRRLQEEGHVLCFTWSALVYQFRAGIMLLYLIWATRPIANSSDDETGFAYNSPEALEACTKSLACFTDRWSDTLPYSKIFKFIKQQILGLSSQSVSNEDEVSLEEAEVSLAQLKQKYLHRAIQGMIEDMMYVGIPQYEATPSEFTAGTL